MKKLLILAIACMIAGTLSAQVTLGVRGGMNLANFVGSEVVEWGFANTDPTAQIKFHLGAYAAYFLTEDISIQPGIFYSAKGPKYEGTTEVFDFNTGQSRMEPIVYKKRLGYIDIPILVYYHLNENISVFAGPQVSFLLSAKVKNDASAEVLNDLGLEEEEDVKDSYRTVDLGFPVGVAYDLGNRFNVQVNYDFGLLNIAKGYDIDGGAGEDNYFKVRNGVLKVSVGFLLHELNVN